MQRRTCRKAGEQDYTVAVVISPTEKLLQNRVLVHCRLQKNRLRLYRFINKNTIKV